ERPSCGELLGPLAGGPRDLLLAAVGLDRLDQARRERKELGDRFVLAERNELRAGGPGRIVVRDARRRLDHLGQRPVRDPLTVREAAPGENRRALEPGDEVARQAALADAGLPVDGHEMRTTIANGSLERVPQQRELHVAAHERGGEGPERSAARGGGGARSAEARGRGRGGTRRRCACPPTRTRRTARPDAGPLLRRGSRSASRAREDGKRP